ncbi:MAG: hypothetical protein NT038_06140, partial [Euryarchaeota archaeon]|nr:hypothetical protein [Euryarchaeota archaeon]
MYLRKLESIMGVGICFVILIGLPGCVTPNKTNEGWMEYFDDNTNSDVVNASIEASDWLTNQDITIEDHLKRPVFVSWLDNGFTDPIIGGHPTVGDSYEKGIPPTSNFYIAKSEKEAVAVWIVRLLLEDLYNNGGSLSIPVKDILHKYLDDDKINDTVSWVENPTSSPSYNSPIGAKYDEELSKNYRVGDMFVQNALYHDITETLNSSLNDEDMTWLYHFLQESTQYSIRYFGTEGRDVDIFNRFGFFAEKSFVLNALKSNVNGHYYNPEDDFVKIYYTGYQINADGTPGSNARWSAEEYNKLTDEQKRYARITNTGAEYKDDYFNSMFYKTYIGTPPQT